MCCVPVLGAVDGGLASSAHEWLLQRLGAVIAQRGIAAVALGRLRPPSLASGVGVGNSSCRRHPNLLTT